MQRAEVLTAEGRGSDRRGPRCAFLLAVLSQCVEAAPSGAQRAEMMSAQQRRQRLVTFAGRVTPELRGAAGIPDEAVVDAMRQIKRRVQTIQKEGRRRTPSPSASPSAERPLSPLNTNPCRFTEQKSFESDYQYMCRTGQAANDGVVQHRLSKDGFFQAVRKRDPFASASSSSGTGPHADMEPSSDTFRAVMELPSLTRRERAIANRVPGKKFVEGRSVYPWDANGGVDRPDHIAVLDGLRYVRTGNPVLGSEAQWSARREMAAKMGVSAEQLAELSGAEFEKPEDPGLQIWTPQVPKTNAARTNYAISSRNNNFGANKGPKEYGQQKKEDDPTIGIMPHNPAHRGTGHWKGGKLFYSAAT